MSDSTIQRTRPRVRTFEQMNAEPRPVARLSPELVEQLKSIVQTDSEDPMISAKFRLGEMPGSRSETRAVLDWCLSRNLPDHFAAVVQARATKSIELTSREHWPRFVAKLRDCPSVESLAIRIDDSLGRLAVGDRVLVDFVQGHPDLSCLRLDASDICPGTMSALMDEVAIHPGLRRLELDSGPAAMEWLPRLGVALERNHSLEALALRLDAEADPDDRWLLGLQYASICRSIAASPDLPLRRLEMTSLDLTDSDDRAGKAIADMLDVHRDLQALVLEGAQGLWRRTWEILGSMTELETLSVAHMSDSAPYVNSADALAGLLMESASLQSVDASHACLEPRNIRQFAHAIASTRVPRVHLESCEMPWDTQGAVLAALPRNTTLTHFSLAEAKHPDIERTLVRNRDMASDGYRRWVTGAVASALQEKHLPKDIVGEIAGHVMGGGAAKDDLDARHLAAVNHGVPAAADVARRDGASEPPAKKARHI